MKVALAIHGGAGNILKKNIASERVAAYEQALTETLHAGYEILKKGGSALDAVEKAVCLLEDCPLFNAGRGAVLNVQGEYEMDASVMDGETGLAGAVAMIQQVKNPVALARAVMEKTPHVFIGGQGAEEFAKSIGMPSMEKTYFHDEYRYQQWMKMRGSGSVSLDHDISSGDEKKFGTVGAVACDAKGNLAAATSTGGMMNKMKGRIGDSPLIGVATYANNESCAISCTGHGEIFIKQVVAYDIHCLMQYKGMSLQEACDFVVNHKLMEVKGEGGLIATDKSGEVVIVFNTPGMFRAMKTPAKEEVAIFF